MIDEMRKRSGEVDSSDPLVCLFYILFRDGHLAPGVLEDAMLQIAAADGELFVFSNGWLASYAIDIAMRLKTGKDEHP